jgi:hypothetical protein
VLWKCPIIIRATRTREWRLDRSPPSRTSSRRQQGRHFALASRRPHPKRVRMTSEARQFFEERTLATRRDECWPDKSSRAVAPRPEQASPQRRAKARRYRRASPLRSGHSQVHGRIRHRPFLSNPGARALARPPPAAGRNPARRADELRESSRGRTRTKPTWGPCVPGRGWRAQSTARCAQGVRPPRGGKHEGGDRAPPRR